MPGGAAVRGRSYPGSPARVADVGPLERLSARLFEEAARRSGLNRTELSRQLGVRLRRDSLTPHTVRGWCRGVQPGPLEALLAMCSISQVRPPDILRAVVASSSRVGSGDLEVARLVGELWWL